MHGKPATVFMFFTWCGMAKLSHYKRSKTTAIRNDMLQNPALSLKAKGLLCLLLSFPDGWEYRRSHIVSLSTGGVDTWKRTIRELMTHGYVVRHSGKDEGGKWEYNYLVSDTPIAINDAESFAKSGRL